MIVTKTTPLLLTENSKLYREMRHHDIIDNVMMMKLQKEWPRCLNVPQPDDYSVTVITTSLVKAFDVS